MFSFFRRKEQPPNSGDTLYPGARTETPEYPPETDQDSDSSTQFVPLQSTPVAMTMSEYIIQKGKESDTLRVDFVATQKSQEHAAAKAKLEAARTAGADARTIEKLQHEVDFLQMFLNELRVDGFVPFNQKAGLAEITREINRINSRKSLDPARDEQTLTMLFEAKDALEETQRELEEELV